MICKSSVMFYRSYQYKFYKYYQKSAAQVEVYAK